MGSIHDTTLTIGELELSPQNVRPNTPDASDLEPSISAVGLKEPILVHPMLGRKGKFGVFAGGRRFKACRAIVGRGEQPADWPISVRIHEGFSDADLLTMSLVENETRRDMQPHEVYAATKKIIARGGTVEHLAELLGRDPGEAKRWLRLGNLAKPIFEALARGEVKDEEARAYAATEDTALQLAAFEQLRGQPDFRRDAPAIRAALGFDDADNRRWLALVGDEAYREAGGGFELDMFAADALHRGRVADVPLLHKLRDTKLDALRAELRAAAGRDLRFVAEPPQHPHYQGADGFLRIASHQDVEPTAAAQALPAGDIVGHINTRANGQVEVAWYWASRKAKAAGSQPPRAMSPSTSVREPGREPVVAAGAALGAPASAPVRQHADAAIRREEGLSIEGVQILASLRRRVLQAALVDDATRKTDDIATDLLIWSQLRLAFGRESSRNLGLRGLAQLDPDSEAARPHLNATNASRTRSAAIAELQAHSFMEEPDSVVAFAAFFEADDRLKRVAAAVVAGLALERSLQNAPGYEAPFHDFLARHLGLATDEGVRQWWTPTAEFLELIPAKERLAIAEPFVERVTAGAWQRLKSADLTQQVLSLVTGQVAGVRRGMAEAAARWVHPLLRFRPPPAPPGAVGAAAPELAEAAE